jgi:2,4-dienoyl-CoA reductase (NADPH2)
MFVPRGHMVAYAAQIKQAVGVPVMAVGRLDDPALAARVVEEGSADLVILGRGLIADPDWPRKVEEGDLDGVRPCIACNACVDVVGRHEELRCAVNPEAGLEATWAVVPAATAKRVMVVGAGPAGMEAARVARLRGHDVSIWERDAELGGKLDVASRAPSKGEVLRFRDYQVRTLRELGVQIRVGVEVTPEVVEAEDPEVVVVATGAEPVVRPIPGIDGTTVVDAQEILYGRVEVASGEHVAIVGGSATGCETAEYLAQRGAAVTILEMLPSIGTGIEVITRRHLIRELRSSGVEILTKARVTAIEQDRVVYETADGATGAVPATRVALALGWTPRGERLSTGLEGRPVLVLGDASHPADFVAATQSGAAAGRSI